MEDPSETAIGTETCTDIAGTPDFSTPADLDGIPTSNTIGLLLDACQTAKRVMEALRPLPDDIRSAHAHVIDTIYLLHQRGMVHVHVSDISAARHVTRPNVTKLVNELADKGLVEKQRDPADGRAVTVDLTESGRELRRIYIGDYHRLIADRMSPLPSEDVHTTIRVINALYAAVDASKTNTETN